MLAIRSAIITRPVSTICAIMEYSGRGSSPIWARAQQWHGDVLWRSIRWEFRIRIEACQLLPPPKKFLLLQFQMLERMIR